MQSKQLLLSLNILAQLANGEKYPGQDKDLEDPLQKPYAQPVEIYNMSQEDQDIILNAHNKYRNLHRNTGDLTWNNTLAEYAARFVASYDCASGTIEHSTYDFGENIAIGHSVNGSVNGWYSEIKDFDFHSPHFSESTGHFSQLIWKETSQIGCAVRYCNSYWGNITVCEYDPSGNWDYKFAENVQPLVKESEIDEKATSHETQKKNPVIRFDANVTTTLSPSTQTSTSHSYQQNSSSTQTHDIYEGGAINVKHSVYPTILAFIIAIL